MEDGGVGLFGFGHDDIDDDDAMAVDGS